MLEAECHDVLGCHGIGGPAGQCPGLLIDGASYSDWWTGLVAWVMGDAGMYNFIMAYHK